MESLSGHHHPRVCGRSFRDQSETKMHRLWPGVQDGRRKVMVVMVFLLAVMPHRSTKSRARI